MCNNEITENIKMTFQQRNKNLVNNILDFLKAWLPLAMALAVISITVGPIHNQLVIITHFDSLIVWIGAFIISIGIEILGLACVDYKVKVETWNDTKNSTDLPINVTFANVLLGAYVFTLIVLVLVTEVIPHLGVLAILVIVALVSMTYLFKAYDMKLERAMSAKTDAKINRSKMAEYRSELESAQKQIKELIAQNKMLSAKNADNKDAAQLESAQKVSAQPKAKKVSGKTNAKDERRMQLLALLKDSGAQDFEALNFTQIGAQLSCSKDTVRRDLDWLKNNNYLRGKNE